MNRFLGLIFAVYLTLTGCTAKAPDDSFHIVIASNPPGADITICNNSTGQCVSNVKTPFKMVLSRNQDTSWPTRFTVECSKEGYVDVARTLHFGVGGWYLLILDKATSETLEIRDVDGYRLELELPIAKPVDISPGDSLTMTSMSWCDRTADIRLGITGSIALQRTFPGTCSFSLPEING